MRIIYIKIKKIISKLHLIFVDDKDTSHICDCCDERKQCAHINDISNNVTVICEECLHEILNEF